MDQDTDRLVVSEQHLGAAQIQDEGRCLKPGSLLNIGPDKEDIEDNNTIMVKTITILSPRSEERWLLHWFSSPQAVLVCPFASTILR